ncbi:MAG: acyl transferase [Flavitalea sp.]
MNCEHEDKVFRVNEAGFEALALDIFRFQAQNNAIYGEYIRHVGIDPVKVEKLSQIPFLPISLFKTHKVICGEFEPEVVFESSGTTGMVSSKHLVKKTSIYTESFLKAFELFYGAPSDWVIIGLLPSYLERSASSLVMMADVLIKKSGKKESGFYLYEHEKLAGVLTGLTEGKQKTILIGVSFALLDFGEQFKMDLADMVIMETGGMKGRRAEITRPELHRELMDDFKVRSIHSEYGMTELLSQAYSTGGGIFRCPPWMKAMVREEDDPLSVHSEGKGILNIIDLANIYSCSFIATDDIGIVNTNGSFEVQGRMDNSDVRGCSLMVSDMR